ncbi:SDR family oxidoreductase [Haliea sp. E1-2-M8]|uniref:SDR family NAD(P)-dependent oxidoreductase n=1 Tax=Haliea sp. E1-2-M8 TaxID=3064706 RepID=UPI00271AB364|nr:SDR family oxidoreductase [Haliea sp. E1-2-M8]MDO8861471.1 SDR family oxidoreductase [Haliea sp. E1-2-M8]
MTRKRTALVTGASAGLGAEFARQLAAADYNLVLVARRRDKLEALAADLQQQYGCEVLIEAADLADPGAPRALFDSLAARDVAVDFLVNNAGVAGSDLLTDRDWADHQAFFQLMMLAVAELCHLFIPGMRERGFGRVINVASVAGRIPRVGGCNYGPSKAYLVALSEDLAVTLHGSGVKVCALCPGYTHTDFHSTAGLQDMKDAMPRFLWYDAKVVVREGLQAVEKGKPVYLSGRLYRWLDPLFQSLLTRRLFRVASRH